MSALHLLIHPCIQFFSASIFKSWTQQKHLPCIYHKLLYVCIKTSETPESSDWKSLELKNHLQIKLKTVHDNLWTHRPSCPSACSPWGCTPRPSIVSAAQLCLGSCSSLQRTSFCSCRSRRSWCDALRLDPLRSLPSHRRPGSYEWPDPGAQSSERTGTSSLMRSGWPWRWALDNWGQEGNVRNCSWGCLLYSFLE